MSYQLSISKGYQYSNDNSFSKITEDEWNQFISDNPNFAVQDKATGRNPKTGEEIHIALNNTAKHLELGFYIAWKDGILSTNLIEELLPEYRAIAKFFSAKLYGEEGETY